MAATDERTEKLLRKSFQEIQSLRSALQQATAAASEPIAIVGMACRTPGGVVDPEGFWRLLDTGTDAIRPFPARWNPEEIYDPDPDALGKSYVREGGFLDDVEKFDAEFFGITPQEAQQMDPQQRLLLETAWEAFERASFEPGSLHESRTGVYVGAMSSGYGEGIVGLEDLDGYRTTGVTGSVLAGRISYCLGLQGPSMTVDTACSSSLAALHLGCAGLRARECDIALVGGVTVMCTTTMFVEFSRLRASAPDGRCKAFSDQANGAGWSEGCGALVLKRLSDAKKDGDRILAVVRATAINQDGKSQGLTAPNGPSQSRLIRRALEIAHLTPNDIDAIEAHGTGTRLGDPIEANALAEVFGPSRASGSPVWLGSSKSNLGHCQAAAGILGVIKLVLALEHEKLPRTLHVDEPTRQVAWEQSGLALLQEPQPWPLTAEHVRRAGVSSFGIGGTNAHAIIEGAEVASDHESQPDASRPRQLPLLLSGRDAAALRAQAAAWLDWVETRRDSDLAEAAYAAAVARTHFKHRACVPFDNVKEALDALRALANGQALQGTTMAVARERKGVVFVFSGQGSQWRGMGRSLLEQVPVFHEAVRECDLALKPHTGWSVEALLTGEKDAPSMDRIDVVQPALFTMSIALAAVWKSLGVQPKRVVGHSQGEISAAVVAGALTLTDGARVVAVRSQLQYRLSGTGAMAFVDLPVAEVEHRFSKGKWKDLSIAVVNTPTSTVVAGAPESIDLWMRYLENEGVFCKRVASDVAGHTAHMDSLLPELRAKLDDIEPRTATVPMVSTVTGTQIDGASLDAEYWCRNVREPVRLDKAVRDLLRQGHDTFVEISPHPILALPLSSTCGDEPVAVVGSVSRESGGLHAFMANLGALHVAGYPIDWAGVAGTSRPPKTAIPTCTFQRKTYWVQAAERPAQHRLSKWLYEVTWEPVSSSATRSGRTSVLWVCEDQEPWQPWLDALQEAAGSIGCTSHATNLYDFLAGAYDGVEETFAHTVLLASTGGDLRASLPAQVEALQRILRPGDTTLWVATRTGMNVLAGDAVDFPLQHASWGLARTVGIEHCERWGALLDLPAVPTRREAVALVEALLRPVEHGDELALRQGKWFGRRLRRVTSGARASDFRTTGTALITGGTGALGSHLAKWLVGRGTQRVILTSRRGPSAPGAEQLVREIERLGATTEIVACDVSKRADVVSLLETIGQQTPPLRFVAHAAGTSEVVSFDDLNESQVIKMLHGKVDGAQWLAELTDELHLDAFVLYGSLSGLYGAPGFAAYAAANAALVGIAEARRARGRPATTIHWGPWAGGGMLYGELEEDLERQGMPAMRPSDALDALGNVLAASAARDVAIFDVDWKRFAPPFATRAPTRKLFEGIVEVRGVLRSTHDAAPDAEVNPHSLDSLEPAELREEVNARVMGALKAVLGLDATTPLLPERCPLDIGLNSIRGVELARSLRAALGAQVPATAILRASTVGEIVAAAIVAVAPDLPQEQGQQAIRSLGESGGGGSGWLVPLRESKEACVRLLCFAYAGGGAAVYGEWRDQLPEWVEALAVELPGRGRRSAERHVVGFPEIVEGVAEELKGRRPLPTMVFGHCLGAIVGFEFCREWLARGERVHHLFVSGAPAPNLYTAPSTDALTDSQLVEMLEEIGLSGLNAMKLDSDFMQAALQVMRNDMRLAGSYDLPERVQLPIPITAFSASSDVFAASAAVDLWRHYTETRDGYFHYQYSGGHYFIEAERKAILRIANEVFEAFRAEAALARIHPIRMAPRPANTVVMLTGGSQRREDFSAVIEGAPSLLLEAPGDRSNSGLPLRRLEPLVTLFEGQLASIPTPVVLFGHFFSAHVALEVAKRRLHRGLPVAHLVVSCAMAPDRYYMPPWRLPEAERLLAQETRKRLRENPSCAARVDAELSAAFHYRPGSDQHLCLDIPVTAIVASDDEVVPAASMPAWAKTTTGAFDLVRVTGGNMYFLKEPGVLRDVLLQASANIAAGPAPHPAGRLPQPAPRRVPGSG